MLKSKVYDAASLHLQLTAHFLIGLDEPVPVVHHDAIVVFVFWVEAEGHLHLLFLTDQSRYSNSTGLCQNTHMHGEVDTLNWGLYTSCSVCDSLLDTSLARIFFPLRMTCVLGFKYKILR